MVVSKGFLLISSFLLGFVLLVVLEGFHITTTERVSTPFISKSQDLGSKTDTESEKKYEEWVRTFKAFDPTFQEKCMVILNQGNNGWSQYKQDSIVFFNLFKYWPMQGRKGFYVDSGTNEAFYLSNSAFFDKCLGWPGLCVEPNPHYHAEIRAGRSCKLIAECISDKKETVAFSHEGVIGHVADADDAADAPRDTQCSPLSDMLKRDDPSRSHIDFWSLDVEGFELKVLRGVDFTEITVGSMLIEEMHLSTRELDFLMNKKGFIKYRQLAVDALYINPNFTSIANNFWTPRDHDDDIQKNREYRAAYITSKEIC
jgi:FkbM family methyltransferase